MSFDSKKLGAVLTVVCLLLCCTVCGHAATAKSDTVIPRVNNGPVLRGDLSDPRWNKGVLLGNFKSLAKKDQATIQQTTVRVLYDSDYLYLGISCAEANMAGLVARARGRDSTVWKDDSMEVLIDTANSKHGFYHFFVNPVGGYFGSKCVRGRGSNEEWHGDFKVKSARGKKGWTTELAIPFASMGLTPTSGLVWGMNVCRNRIAGTEELSTWSASPWGFERPECFGQVILGDNSAKWNGTMLLSWGDMGTSDVSASNNKVSCLIPNHRRTPLSAFATLEKFVDGKKNRAVAKKIVVKPMTSGSLDIPYTIAGADGGRWTLNIASNGTQLFKVTRDVPAISEPKRVWALKDPLYKELLSNNRPGDQQYGSIYWLHTYDPYGLPQFAKEFGIRYSNEEAVKELADARLLPLREASSFNDEFFLNTLEKYHAKLLYFPDIAHWTAPDAPKSWDASFLLDPRSKTVYMDDLKSGLAEWHKYIWGVYSGDEIDNWVMHQAVELYADHRNDYPYIRQVNEQVKNVYGGGKYGIPESLRDSNPYRWIALRRWVMNDITNWQKDIYDTVKGVDPEIRVISMDPPGSHRPVSFDREAKYFDIATHQLYAPSDPNRQQFGFITKLVSDLTGKPTWTCAHVEHYSFSMTTEEVRELMSEVMRSGGKGFHYWLKDEIGKNSDNGFMKATKWGYPERWQAICEINRLNSQMNEVAVPHDPDFALFYSEDYYSSFSELHGISNEPEWAYTFFGPVSRTWFKFINDNMVEDGTVDLSKYKALVVMGAKYERKNVADSLVQYVNNGGTLVVADPEAFSNDVTDEPLTEVRTKLIGGPVVASKEQESMTFSADGSLPEVRGKKLPITKEAFVLNVGPNTEVLATFPDGTPAVIRNRVGNGSVIVFASNPFTQSGISDDGWKSFFKAFSKSLGLKTDRDIWRFEYPAYKSVKQPVTEGECLTGNYVRFYMDVPTYPHNAAVSGTYSYSVAPDGIPDRGVTKVAFSTGKLTDRKSAYTTPTVKLNPDNFCVSWKTEKAVDVTFDLLKARNLSSVHFWYSGQLPNVKVVGSLDGKTWTDLNTYPGQVYVKPDGAKSHEDVLDVSIRIPKDRQVRYVRLRFGKRDAGSPFSLAECEVWGDAH